MIDDFLKQLSDKDQLFFSAFQYAAIGMALVAPDGKWLMVNKSLCQLTGYSEEELLKITFQDLTHPEDLDEDMGYVKQMLAGTRDTYQMEKRYFHKNGQIIHILLSVSLVKDKNNAPLFFVSQIQDITEQKLMQKELVKQATLDPLTGTNNRRHFFTLAERDIQRGSRYSEDLVLLMLDIDHFKAVNDTYGHSIGDEALKKMVDVCRTEIRSFDIFGRIGGEEFCILLTKSDATSGFTLAERLRKAVENSFIVTDKGVIKFTVSIGGIAFSGNGSLETLMKQADNALYQAKNSGRNKTVIHDQSVQQNKEERVLREGFIRLKWRKEYESGNEQIDKQHYYLFKLSNILLAAMIESEDMTTCLQYMEQLLLDITEHFQTEEKIIEAAGFPDNEEHRKTHQDLIKKAEKLVQQYKDGTNGIGEVFYFLTVQVVKQHLLLEDRKFFTYLTP